jgi:anti-anti-sigma regulatory factor
MSIRERAVSVHQVPIEASSANQSELLARFRMCAESGTPRLVLDCSKIWEMNQPMIELLLSCLEEVMMHNGDVRLAMLRPDGYAALRLCGVDKLFEVYPTVQSAIESFQLHLASMAPYVLDNAGVATDSDCAA